MCDDNRQWRVVKKMEKEVVVVVVMIMKVK
jgi:hypothetical protein